MQQLLVLHFQAIAEQDWLLDTFSAERGRQKLILKRPSVSPDLFIQYQCDWFEKTDWPNIKVWQPQQTWRLDNSALYCGLYLNELMVALLPLAEPLPNLYKTYQHTLQALAENQWSEPWLRMFEWQLLQQLGYGFSWQRDQASQVINPQNNYQFIPAAGFVKADTGFSGNDILAFAQGSKEVRVWQLAKRIFRLALDDLLSQPLCSRSLFVTNVATKIDNSQPTKTL